jgi:hypothetical protein
MLKDIELVLVAFVAALIALGLIGGEALESVVAALGGALAMAARGGQRADT